MNKKIIYQHQLARQINKIPSTYETNFYFANNKQIAFYIERLLYFCTAADKFLSFSYLTSTLSGLAENIGSSIRFYIHLNMIRVTRKHRKEGIC